MNLKLYTKSLFLIGVILFLACLSGCAAPTEPAPEPTATPIPSDTPEPTVPPTATNTPEPTETPLPSPTPTPDMPSHSEVLAKLPPGAETCNTYTEVKNVLPDGRWTIIIPAGTPLHKLSETNIQIEFPLNCYGVHVTLNTEVTINGVTYPEGTLLTLHPDSTPDPIPTFPASSGVQMMIVEDTEAQWEAPEEIIWIAVSSWN